jgi:hypothetical protein
MRPTRSPSASCGDNHDANPGARYNQLHGGRGWAPAPSRYQVPPLGQEPLPAVVQVREIVPVVPRTIVNTFPVFEADVTVYVPVVPPVAPENVAPEVSFSVGSMVASADVPVIAEWLPLLSVADISAAVCAVRACTWRKRRCPYPSD